MRQLGISHTWEASASLTRVLERHCDQLACQSLTVNWTALLLVHLLVSRHLVIVAANH